VIKWFKENKGKHMYKLNSIYDYDFCGKSKQAVHQYFNRELVYREKAANLLTIVIKVRNDHPKMSARKLYKFLKPDFLGRDRFEKLVLDHGLRIFQPKSYKRTTFPGKVKYPNLIEGKRLNRVNQVWVSDITYFKIGDTFYYLAFILDVYSRKIVGYNASRNLMATMNLAALQMAISNENPKSGLIHHSDYGCQYSSKKYLELLKENECIVSMGGKALENSYAERLNGIIKNEYLKFYEIKSFSGLKSKLKKVVNLYNEERPHKSLIQWMSPVQFANHIKEIRLSKRPIVKIYDFREKTVNSI